MKKAEATRLNILQKAFGLIYTNGYQTTSIDQIIATTQVTKGAFFYHFKNKDEMALAMIKEILQPKISGVFNVPFQKEENPVKAIYNLIDYLLMKDDFMLVEFGCPVGNLTQEMAPWNPILSSVLDQLTNDCITIIVAAINKGKKDGYIRKEVNARQVALFVMSGYWGIRNFGKLENNKKVYLPYLKELKNYLSTLE